MTTLYVQREAVEIVAILAQAAEQFASAAAHLYGSETLMKPAYLAAQIAETLLEETLNPTPADAEEPDAGA